MAESFSTCVLVSDFNIENLSGYLSADGIGPIVSTTVAPFGHVIPTLLESPSEIWSPRPDVAVIWTRPEGVIESFAELLDGGRPVHDRMLEELDRYTDTLKGVTDRAGVVLVPTWVVPAYQRGLGLMDFKSGGVALALMQMNLHLAERLRDSSNIYVVNAQKWVEAAGAAAFNPKYWYMGKMAFSGRVFKEAALDIKAAVRAASGQARKLIMLDLDDTLWGGIVGEVGWQNLRLGGHDPIGEAFVDFQRALRVLRRRGIVLAISSKNDESVAMEAIRRHPEMVLRPEDFVAWRINWGDKAANIADLVGELNLGLQSVVFIDDQPAERARVREALPEVLVPDWPAEQMLYRQALQSLRCFDAVSISDEDRQRTQMYATQRERDRVRESVGSVEQWLRSLDLTVGIETVKDTNRKRVVQLLNKTNQMNLSTRRLSDVDLAEWLGQGQRAMWCFRVSDQFGDSGLTGILSVDSTDGVARIVDFVLSCRVFGRRIEWVMLRTVIDYAKSLGLKQVVAAYKRTEKNKPCLEFFGRSGFERDNGEDVFRWDTQKPYAAPDFIKVVLSDEALCINGR